MKQSVWKLSLGHHWTFRHDNDLKHMAQIVAKYLEDSKIKVLAYPVWNPSNLEELEAIAKQEWSKIPVTLQ